MAHRAGGTKKRIDVEGVTEAGDGGKIREELKRILPEYRPEDGGRRTDDRGQMIHHRDTEGTEKKEKNSVSPCLRGIY